MKNRNDRIEEALMMLTREGIALDASLLRELERSSNPMETVTQ